MSKNPIVRLFVSLFTMLRRFIFLVGFLVVVGMILLIVKSSAGLLGSPEYTSRDKLLLKLKLDGELQNKSSTPHGFTSFLYNLVRDKKREFYPFDLKSLLTAAKSDPQVVGLYLDITSLEGSYAEFAEFRKLLVDFKNNSKRIDLWAPSLDNKTLYIASIADKVHIPPQAQVFIPGPMFQMVYAGEAFRKLGVSFEVIRAGQFKSAFEPLVSDDPSPETQKSYGAVEQSLRNHMVKRISNGRKVEESRAESWFRRSLFTAKEAFAEKIVDGLSYREEFEDQISKDAKIVNLEDYTKFSYKEAIVTRSKGIAFIEAVGEMYLEEEPSGDSSIDFETLHEELKWAREEQDVKAVVLRIDSPGGSALAADMLWEDVRRLREVKPVVVSMGAYAASGGYYMAVPASRIIAYPSTITGSIGVIGLSVSVESFKQKYGVSIHTFSHSDRKNMLNPGSKLTEEDRNILNSQVRSTYEGFVQKVANGRKKSFNEIDALAQGRIWTGEQALEVGLVDALGTLTDAFTSAKELANLDVEKLYPILRYEGPKSSFTKCLKSGKIFKCLNYLTVTPDVLQNSLGAYLPMAKAIAHGMEVPKERVLTLLPPMDVR